MTSQQLLDEVPNPDISHLAIEDGKPVDNLQSEKQQRLLVEPLYSAMPLAYPFLSAANVGVFYALKQDPIVPDVFLSLEVEIPADWSQKRHRSYFVWEFGKVPEVCIEIVSNREGHELGSKKLTYARIGVPYYVVFDPLQQIQEQSEMNGASLKVFGLTHRQFVELSEPFYLEAVGLGLTLWQGDFEGKTDQWLRWCDRQGHVIPTGAERANQEAQRANQEAQRANQEAQRANRLAERLRQMGINPEEV